MTDIALVPQRDILEASDEVAAQDPGQTAQPFRGDGVAFVRHRRRTLLGGAKSLPHLTHFGALQMPHLGRDEFDRCAYRRARVKELGVAVARHYLRRGHGHEPEGRTDVALHRRVDVRVRAHGAAELADRDRPAGRDESSSITVDLETPEREFGAKRRGFGMDSVGTSDHGRGAELERAALQHCGEVAGRGDQQVTRGRERGAQRRIDHVGGREPVVNPARRGLADRVLHHVDEGHLLALEHLRHERGVDDRSALAGLGREVVGHDADRRRALHCEELNLEPQREAGLIGEETSDLGKLVAGDHVVIAIECNGHGRDRYQRNARERPHATRGP